ncbi:MAG: S8 family serine peptidase [Candidatus Nanoarchaeia archaeon]
MAKTDSLLIAICGLALTIVAVALLFAKPPLTGAVVAVEFIEPLSITATENANIDLNLDTNINSFKLTGNFTGQSFSIYLLFGEQKQKLLVVEGEGNISFLESCKETCEFSGEPSYALEIQIQNGTLWLDGYKYGKPELVSIEVAEKVEPEVLVEQNPSVIVLINEDADVEKLIDAGLKIKYDYEEFNAIAGTIAKNNLAKLAANPDIEAIKADAQYQITLNDSVPLIKAPQVWQIQVSGVNVTGDTETICIIDTGVNYSHPALATNYLGGVDFVNNDSDPMDDHNHGTHVAGIILSNDAFYRGVAPGAKFVAVKAFDSGGSGSLSNILAAMDWCVANKDTYNISVMSMSFGDGGQHNSDDCPTIFDSPINAAIAAGITPVAASGNNGYANGVSSPACSPGVVAVGAVNDADSVASWSNSGALLDLLAPGVSIISTGKSGNFISMSGTSMATPHVSGVFALLQHYNKLKTGAALTPADAEAKLKSTGVIIIDPKNNLATPRVDAFAAITSSYIIIESPLNRTYGTGKLDFNITVDPSVYNAIFSIDAGANNTMTNDSATHWYNNSINELASGQHNATFYTFGDNINNSKTVFFSITTDTTPPQILLNSPANNSAVAIGRPINFTVIDDVQLQTVWYERNGTNTTIDSNNSIYLINTTTWTKGLQKITVYANDSA